MSVESDIEFNLSVSIIKMLLTVPAFCWGCRRESLLCSLGFLGAEICNQLLVGMECYVQVMMEHKEIGVN